MDEVEDTTLHFSHGSVSLNPEQYKIVTADPYEHQRILASAGSGTEAVDGDGVGVGVGVGAGLSVAEWGAVGAPASCACKAPAARPSARTAAPKRRNWEMNFIIQAEIRQR